MFIAIPRRLSGANAASLMVSAHSRNWWRSSCGIASIMVISRFGRGLAKSATISTCRRSTIAATSSSAARLMLISHDFIARGVKARDTDRRSRVCTGGSVAFMVCRRTRKRAWLSADDSASLSRNAWRTSS
nr:hypothetical protein CPGR_01437 [Mycolicibacter nonchromogenicus]